MTAEEMDDELQYYEVKTHRGSSRRRWTEAEEEEAKEAEAVAEEGRLQKTWTPR